MDDDTLARHGRALLDRPARHPIPSPTVPRGDQTGAGHRQAAGDGDYHRQGNRTDNGATVAEGEFLGNIGVDVSCGGGATGPHVHFSLRQNAEYVEYALHGSTRANLGGSLYNNGRLDFTLGIVDTNGDGATHTGRWTGTADPVNGWC